MPNDQTTLLKINVPGAISVGPFRAGVAYPVPNDVVALLGDRFVPAATSDKVGTVGDEHQQVFEEHRARKKAADEAKAKAEAEAKAKTAASNPTQPANAGTNGG